MSARAYAGHPIEMRPSAPSGTTAAAPRSASRRAGESAATAASPRGAAGSRPEEEEQRAHVRDDRAGLAILARVEVEYRVAGHGEQGHRDQDHQPEPEGPGRVGEGPVHDGGRPGGQWAEARGIVPAVFSRNVRGRVAHRKNVARTQHWPGMTCTGAGMIGPRPCAGLPGLSELRSASWPLCPLGPSFSSRPVRSRRSRSGR